MADICSYIYVLNFDAAADIFSIRVSFQLGIYSAGFAQLSLDSIKTKNKSPISNVQLESPVPSLVNPSSEP